MNPEQYLPLACQALGLDAKHLQHFQGKDPFNGDIPVSGFISHKPDHRYGALFIHDVGGERSPQVVFGTPKLHYPFSKDGKFHFPAIREASIHEKLDGTNILAYSYRGADGRELHSFKLRLAPFVRNGKWGGFLDQWRQITEMYPGLTQMTRHNDCNVSFEMYGGDNPHLIVYEKALDVALLFGVDRRTGDVVPSSSLTGLGVPCAPVIAKLTAAGDPVGRFQELRRDLEKRNRKTGDGKIIGTEGAVWCVSEPGGRVSLWKCKPESVEAIHWAGGINKEAVVATCWNALEHADTLDFKVLEPMLLEEYQGEEIAKFRDCIDRCIAEVRKENEFRQMAREAYGLLRERGLSLPGDKVAIMRDLSNKFPKDMMTKVYSAISSGRGGK